MRFGGGYVPSFIYPLTNIRLPTIGPGGGQPQICYLEAALQGILQLLLSPLHGLFAFYGLAGMGRFLLVYLYPIPNHAVVLCNY